VFAETELRSLMAERGLTFDIMHAPRYGGCPLNKQLLSGYSQLWFVSGDTVTLDPQQVREIVRYVDAGNGLAIWADNDPFYADANLLAEALIGSRFSGNTPGDRVMVPGAKRKRGYFIEHPLTQGVNNLYEGITICTIADAPGVTILGTSHDGQSCLGCFESESRRIVLDTGFTKLYTEYFHKSAGLGRYLSNIAFWLARGSRGVDYQLLTPGREKIETFSRGDASAGYQFTVTDPAPVTCILQWDGKATFGLSLRAPNGNIGAKGKSPTSPLRLTVPAPAEGTWTAVVEGVDVKADNIPYVVTLSTERDRARKDGARKDVRSDQVIPFYFVCDVSAGGSAVLDDLSATLRYIQRDMTKTSGDAAMSVIAFDSRARTVTPLATPAGSPQPRLTAGDGRRSYGAALREFHRAFEADRTRLTAAGARIFRPTVFFLTHGDPDDADHAEVLRSLLGYEPRSKRGNRAYPNILPIGLPGAREKSLAALAYPDFGDAAKRGRWFAARPGTDRRQALKSIADAICGSIRDTQASAAQGTPTFVPPASITGLITGVAGAEAR
jgi:hypothetical protein